MSNNEYWDKDQVLDLRTVNPNFKDLIEVNLVVTDDVELGVNFL